MTAVKLPRRVKVAEVLKGRYQPGKKPLSWDERSAAVEQIRTVDGEQLSLFSTGGQSTPAPGWEILLTSEHQEPSGLLWTLYGLGK